MGKIADLILIDGDLKKIFRISEKWRLFLKGIGFSSKKIFDSVKGKLGLD